MQQSLRDHAWTLLLAGALMGLVALCAYAPIFAVDGFWHLKLGEVIVSERAIPTQDLFSAVHPERPYVQFQWLWDVLAYAAERAGGLPGLRWFSVATMCASFGLLGLVAYRAFESRTLAFLFCALSLVLFEDRFQTRPSATALGFTAAMLPIWLGITRTRPRSELFAVYVLACLWSNIHGGEALLAGLGCAALAVGELLATRSWRSASAKRALSLAAASGLGLLSSPTFLSGLSDWSWAIKPQLASGNKEWLPTYTMLENGFTPAFLLIALGPSAVLVAYIWEQIKLRRAAAFGSRADPRASTTGAPLPLAEWLLCGGMLVLSQHAVRNAFLCTVPLAFILRRARGHLSTGRARALTAAMGACLLLIAFDDHVVQGYGGVSEARALIGEDLAPGAFPVELADFVREARIEGGIFNDGRWGGYLIWRLWPSNHVFVDSRQDLTPEMWPLFLAAQSAGTRARAMEAAFKRWGIGLSAFRGPTFPAVRAPRHWQLLYKAGDQELYQRVGTPEAATNIARARDFLAARARDKDLPLEALAVEVGSVRWLHAPYQRHRAQKAAALLDSANVDEAAEGLRLKAGLWFDAGRYEAALGALETLLRAQPGNLKVLYQATLAALALGDENRARSWLKQLAAEQAQLSPQQRNRLRAIDPTDFF
jgi:hypothetical protein